MKRKQQQQKSPRLARQRLIMFGIIAAIASTVGIFSYNWLVPANGTAPVLGFPANHFIKATHSASSGYIFVSQSGGSVKGVRSNSGAGQVNPTYTFNKDGLQSIHVINEDYDTNSVHNFNIDAFNVHTKDLNYFESQTVTFVADKTGTFEYYCTIHPEMKGNIIIE